MYSQIDLDPGVGFSTLPENLYTANISAQKLLNIPISFQPHAISNGL